MRVGTKYITGTFSADQYVKIYENILSSATTSITISSLDGDTDEEYLIITRFVSGYDGVTNFYIYFNNDSTTTNYGYQTLQGVGPGVSASRDTDLCPWLGRADSLGNISMGEMFIYTKSGFVRTVLDKFIRDVSGTTVTNIILLGFSWNNTVDNITSLVIASSQTDGIGIGSSIELYKKKYKS